MNRERPIPGKRSGGCLRAIALIGTVSAGCVALAAAGFPLFVPIEFVFRVLCGWAMHIWHTGLPAVGGTLPALWGPLLCLGGATYLAHHFLAWWAVQRGRIWNPGASVCVVALFLLASASAIAMSGVFHQMMWLAGSKLVRSNQRTNTVEAIHKMKMLRSIAEDFVSEHHRHPESLEELVASRPEAASLIFLQAKDHDSPPERVVYVRPSDTGQRRPMFIGPWFDGKTPVAYTDGSVMISPSNLLVRTLPGNLVDRPADE